jgi:hypothetical protein
LHLRDARGAELGGEARRFFDAGLGRGRVEVERGPGDGEGGVGVRGFVAGDGALETLFANVAPRRV